MHGAKEGAHDMILSTRRMLVLVGVMLTVSPASARSGFVLSPAYERYYVTKQYVEHCFAMDAGGRFRMHYLGGFLANDPQWSFVLVGMKYQYRFFDSRHFSAFAGGWGGPQVNRSDLVWMGGPEMGFEVGSRDVRLTASASYFPPARPVARLRLGGIFYF